MERESSVVDQRAELLKQYSGAVAWAIDRGGVHSRLNLVAAAFTRNRRGPFQVHLTLYSDRQPDGETWTSPQGQFDKDLRLNLGEVFGGDFEGFVEVIATSPNQDLRTQHYNEIWCDYFSDDGRIHLVLPTIQFYGSVKRTLGGQSQIWPGMMATERFRPRIITINPYQEEISFSLSAVSPSGASKQGETLVLPRKSQRRWDVEAVVPELRAWLAPHGGIGNLLITSTHKMICYFALENVETGTITGADHLAWFYGEDF
jgi:hypothetical protein